MFNYDLILALIETLQNSFYYIVLYGLLFLIINIIMGFLMIISINQSLKGYPLLVSILISIFISFFIAFNLEKTEIPLNLTENKKSLKVDFKVAAINMITLEYIFKNKPQSKEEQSIYFDNLFPQYYLANILTLESLTSEIMEDKVLMIYEYKKLRRIHNTFNKKRINKKEISSVLIKNNSNKKLLSKNLI